MSHRPREEPRRILHVVRRFDPLRGGTERYVHDLAVEQVRRGHAVTVLTLDRDVTGVVSGRLPGRARVDGVVVKRVRGTGAKRWAITLQPGQFLRAIVGADVVHLHDFRFHVALVGVATRLLGRPAYLHTHGVFFHTSSLSRLKGWLLRLYHGPMIAVTSVTVVADSASDRDQLIRAAPMLRARTVVIPNAIDLRGLAAVVRRPRPASLLSFGRIAASKGLRELVEVLARLDVPARLVIAGQSEDDEQQVLERRAIALGIRDRVEFVGGFDDQGLLDLLAEATLAVFPSRGEGFGLALVEAMAAGVPTMASDLPSHREVLGPGLADAIFEPGDTERSAAVIANLLVDADRLASLSSRVRERSRQFEVARLADDIDALYERADRLHAAAPSEPTYEPDGSLASVPFMGLTIHNLTFDETVARLTGAVDRGESLVVATPNLDYVFRSTRDPKFRQAIQAADLRVPDGMGIVYASRVAGTPFRGTVTGRLLVPALARHAAKVGAPIALVGAPPGVAAEAGRRLARRFPGVVVALATAPPLGFDVAGEDGRALARAVVESGARIVFVALGAPRQEQWMEHHREALEGRVAIGVGAALDIEAGRFREAPRWMTRYGLEWVFRLVQEPRRLARRYLVDDPVVLVWALRQRIRRRGADAPRD